MEAAAILPKTPKLKSSKFFPDEIADIELLLI